MKSYEETKQTAADVLSEMEYELAKLNRTYNKYLKHGAVNAATQLKEVIDSKTKELESEEWVFKMAFN